MAARVSESTMSVWSLSASVRDSAAFQCKVCWWDFWQSLNIRNADSSDFLLFTTHECRSCKSPFSHMRSYCTYSGIISGCRAELGQWGGGERWRPASLTTRQMTQLNNSENALVDKLWPAHSPHWKKSRTIKRRRRRHENQILEMTL